MCVFVHYSQTDLIFNEDKNLNPSRLKNPDNEMQFKRKVSNDYFCSKRLSKSFSMVTQRGPRTESSNHSCKHETPEERGDKSYNILSIFLYKIKLKLTKN